MVPLTGKDQGYPWERTIDQIPGTRHQEGTPPVDRHTPVKTLPSCRTTYAGSNNWYLLKCCIALVRFKAHFYNDFHATISDTEAFITRFRTEFCDATRISCSRLIRPRDHSDVYSVTSNTGLCVSYSYLEV